MTSVRNKQCKACPWRVDTVPEKDIPGGYCETQHKNLKSTVAKPGDLSTIGRGSISMMACHESRVGSEQACVGWLAHQLGPGNNLALRMMALDGRFRNIETDGPQHECLEDTLPKKKRRKRRLSVVARET